MNATNVTPTPTSVDVMHKSSRLTSPLYRFFGFRVLDVTGKHIGAIEWVWADPATGNGAAIGVHLRWLRGTVRIVPMYGATVDQQTSTLEVPFTHEQMARAPRVSMGRELSPQIWGTVLGHYGLTATGRHRRGEARPTRLTARQPFGAVERRPFK